MVQKHGMILIIKKSSVLKNQDENIVPLRSIILGFIVAILLGGYSNEILKKSYAAKLGYYTEYSSSLGNLNFHSKSIGQAFKSVRANYNENYAIASKSIEWKEIKLRDQQQKAKIELVGKLFTLIISVLGISIFVFRKIYKYEFGLIDLLLLIGGSFFLKEIAFNILYLLRGSIPCEEAAFWHDMNLNLFSALRVHTVIGLMLMLILIFLIPKFLRLKFLMGGGVGSLIGFGIWYFFLGEFLLA